MLKIALINVIKPQSGSRDGITEYTYEIYRRLKKRHKVDLIYVTDVSKRFNTAALISANALFKLRVKKLAKENYDIVHIANQELGYAAKILKENGSGAGIVTSIHDLMRYNVGAYRGVKQKAYSVLVRGSILDAIKYSDYVVFSASTVEKDAIRRFGKMLKNHKTTLLAPSDEFRTKPIPQKRESDGFLIATVGAFVPWKNQIFVLRTAELFKDEVGYRFRLIGSGPDEQQLRDYKKKRGLNNVEFVNFAPQSKFLDMYDSFSMMFYPTTEEGSSLPMINAQCRGLPVVIYKGNRVDREVTKYCLVAKDERDAAKIIKSIGERGFDRKRRNAMIRYARSFSWDRVTKETLDIYKKALEKRKNA